MDREKEVYRRGLYFEEFEIGQEINSVGRTVTEADVVGFASLTGDWTRIHTDAVYAAQHPLGQRVAHGLLGISIAVALATRSMWDGKAYSFDPVSMTARAI